MASSSSSPNHLDLNIVPETLPVPEVQTNIWHPMFSTGNQPVMVNDTLMYNPTNAAAVGAGLITPRDEVLLSTRSDVDVMRDALALTVQATTVTANMTRRLHARSMEVRRLNDHIQRLQRTLYQSNRRMRSLRGENDELKRMVDSYATGLVPRVVQLEGFEDQIREQLERLQKQTEAGPSNSSQDATNK